jgi:CBS domain-containing protein
MLVREVMSSRIFTAKRTDSVRSVVLIMLNHHCGAVPIVDSEDRLVGIISLRDVMMPLYPNYGEYIHDEVHNGNFLEMEEGYGRVLNMKAEDIMTPKPAVVSPDEPVLKAASYMGLRNLRRMPVIEKGKLVGMVSIADINRGFFQLH